MAPKATHAKLRYIFSLQSVVAIRYTLKSWNVLKQDAMPIQTTALRDQVMGIETSKFLPKTIVFSFQDVKSCSLIDTIIVFLDIIHLTQRFGDWILPPSSGGPYSVGHNR
jgi:hypothetical protein